MRSSDENLLGQYLKDRRGKLDPGALGYDCTRRRTPGLRREEVAQRANVSPTWYTWLEQGRGGTPSADAIERIAGALAMSPAEREHLFLLAGRRSSEPLYPPLASVTPRLQRILDSLETSPAYIKTTATDLIAWNRAAVAVYTDYGRLPREERNLLRLLFCDEHVRAKMPNWEDHARFAVATFRLDVARSGSAERGAQLVDELCRESAEFQTIWGANDVSTYGEGTKHILHPIAGPLALEYSAFAVDGQPDLALVVYSPATPADIVAVRKLIADGRDGWGAEFKSRVTASPV